MALHNVTSQKKSLAIYALEILSSHSFTTGDPRHCDRTPWHANRVNYCKLIGQGEVKAYTLSARPYILTHAS